MNRASDTNVLPKMMPIPYGNIATLVFLVVAIRLWIKHGPRIPLIFTGLLAVSYVGFAMWQGIGIPFQLVVCFLGIAMLLVEKVKSVG